MGAATDGTAEFLEGLGGGRVGGSGVAFVRIMGSKIEMVGAEMDWSWRQQCS